MGILESVTIDSCRRCPVTTSVAALAIDSGKNGRPSHWKKNEEERFPTMKSLYALSCGSTGGHPVSRLLFHQTAARHQIPQARRSLLTGRPR